MSFKTIRNSQQLQLAKLNQKADADNELLEFLRDYMKKRADIEADYNKSLDKLNEKFATKKFKRSATAKGQAVGQIADDETSEGTPRSSFAEERQGPGALYIALSTLVQESDKLAKAR
ncbi:hypothetical protein HK096_006664, partial [Nowakowskiella sp. JEL0078]